MHFNDDRSKTVMTISITGNKRSSYTGKTINETFDQKELFTEIHRQLTLIFKDIEYPSNIAFTENYYDFNNNAWQAKDTAYVTTTDGFLMNKSHIYNNLYNCGTHNKLGNYDFTSLESACINAYYLSQQLTNNKINKFKIYNTMTIVGMLEIIIIVVIIVLILRKNN